MFTCTTDHRAKSTDTEHIVSRYERQPINQVTCGFLLGLWDGCPVGTENFCRDEDGCAVGCRVGCPVGYPALGFGRTLVCSLDGCDVKGCGCVLRIIE